MSTHDHEPSPRATIAAFLILAVAVVAAAVVLLASRPDPVRITIVPPGPTATPGPTPSPAPIVVYVTGAVRSPETTVMLAAGSRVQDAIASAGGANPDADLERVNLAALLRDGDQVHVPAQGDLPAALATPIGGELVNVNTADAEELATLPGIGPSLAAAIVAYRQEHGPFESLDDLDSVEGIGPRLLQNLGGRVVFE